MHEEWTDQLSAYLDDELPPEGRRAVESHLADCGPCRRVLADLRAVSAWAPGYEGRPPARDLWPRIAEGIEASRAVPFPAARGRRFSLAQMAAAALLMSALSAGAVWLALGRSGVEAPAVVATADSPLAVPAALLDDPAYDAAVSDLMAVLSAGRGRLDSATVRIIEANLQVIDMAIAEARAAIVADPSNAYLATRIRSNMQRKLVLLRQAAHAAGSAS